MSCEGDLTTFTSDGLTVPFKAFCGKDIQAPLDFTTAEKAENWRGCLQACVSHSPLCYGFDWAPPESKNHNCWLKRGAFDETEAVSQTFTNKFGTTYLDSAGMIDPDFVTRLSEDCLDLGLKGCFDRNKQVLATTTPPSVSTLVTTSVSTVTQSVPTRTGSSSGSAIDETGSEVGRTLSTGARAGIGAGVAVAVLIAMLIFGYFVYKQRKRGTKKDASDTVSTCELDQERHHVEAPGHHPEMSDLHDVHKNPQLFELDTSSRHEKYSRTRYEMN